MGLSVVLGSTQRVNETRFFCLHRTRRRRPTLFQVRSAAILPGEFYCRLCGRDRANNLATLVLVPRAFVDENSFRTKTQQCSQFRTIFCQHNRESWHIEAAM